MTTTYSRTTQCDGKLPYDGKAAAKRAAKRLEQTAGRLIAYHCPHCGAYHVGHRAKYPPHEAPE
jgi:ribosomal protein L32